MRKILIFLVMAATALGTVAVAQAKKAPAQRPEAKLTIAGPPLASEEQAVKFIKKSNPGAKLNCTVEEIVRLYYKEAGNEGIRPDVALSQALLETGFFRYGGDVKSAQNNFCGLGSVGGGAKGYSFATPALGVRAHIQHLLAYSSKKAPKAAIVDPRYKTVKGMPNIFGVCTTWHDLNGRWAQAGIPYGERILDIHRRMLQTEPKGKPPARTEEPRGADPEKEKAEKKKKSRKKKEKERAETGSEQAISSRVREILKTVAKR